MSAYGLVQEIHARYLSARDVMQAYLACIDGANPKVNVIVMLPPHPIDAASAPFLAPHFLAAAKFRLSSFRPFVSGSPLS